MNEPMNQVFLSEDEVLFYRMEAFQRQRVEMIAAGQSPLGKQDNGFLVVHLLPYSSFKCRQRFDGCMLKDHGKKVASFGEYGRYTVSRFNVDGLLKLDSNESPKSYSQVFREGRLEAVMSDIAFEMNDRLSYSGQKSANQPRYLRDTICEQAVFEVVQGYLEFFKSLHLSGPVFLFSALIGCTGVRFYSDQGYGHGQCAVDRSPVYLPDIIVQSTEEEPNPWHRTWCDILSQTIGLEKSPNFDTDGKRHERKR